MKNIGPDWWNQPRRITVFVGEDWILPFAESLVADITKTRDQVILCRNANEIPNGEIMFLLSCTKILRENLLSHHRVNLVVHESDLPSGRGFAPMTWQVLNNCSEIPVCLLEVDTSVDSGPIVYRENICLSGTELCSELRQLQGNKTVELCRRYLAEEVRPNAIAQRGEPTSYLRRTPRDSELDINQTIAQQFNLLRTVDNKRYPAFFVYKGKRFKLTIENDSDGDE